WGGGVGGVGEGGGGGGGADPRLPCAAAVDGQRQPHRPWRRNGLLVLGPGRTRLLSVHVERTPSGRHGGGRGPVALGRERHRRPPPAVLGRAADPRGPPPWPPENPRGDPRGPPPSGPP